MTVIKICGITDLEDAKMAADLGADMLGFNFYPASPRFIDPAKTKEIIEELGGRVGTVGVFVNEPVDLVLRTAGEANVDTIQLHGDETPEYVREIRKKCGLKVIKAFRVLRDTDLRALDGYGVDAILLDSYSRDLYGGTGELSDWEAARQAVSTFPKVFLAGGLNAENVKFAIETVRPYAVDVASGVEAAKGRKDPIKLRDFIRNAREA